MIGLSACAKPQSPMYVDFSCSFFPIFVSAIHNICICYTQYLHNICIESPKESLVDFRVDVLWNDVRKSANSKHMNFLSSFMKNTTQKDTLVLLRRSFRSVEKILNRIDTRYMEKKNLLDTYKKYII